MDYCIDRFEYPNVLGQNPIIVVTFHEAEALCKRGGKRLCNEHEWTFACEGEEVPPYPYGFTRATACVIDRPWRPFAEGALPAGDARARQDFVAYQQSFRCCAESSAQVPAPRPTPPVAVLADAGPAPATLTGPEVRAAASRQRRSSPPSGFVVARDAAEAASATTRTTSRGSTGFDTCQAKPAARVASTSS